MDGRIVRCGIVSSCQSAATSDIVKVLLATSSSHVRSAIANTGLYLYLSGNFPTAQDLGGHDSTAGNKAYCYAELEPFFPSDVHNHASSHLHTHGGMVRLS